MPSLFQKQRDMISKVNSISVLQISIISRIPDFAMQYLTFARTSGII